MEPKVTGIMPVRDTREDWLRVAVSGALHQDYANFNLVIGDNGSTKASTLSTIRTMQERFPDTLRVARTLPDGPAGTAHGLDAAVGAADSNTSWFLKLDSDDMFARGWVSIMMEKARRLPPQVAIVYTNYLMMRYDPRPHLVPVLLRPYDYRAIVEESYIPGPSMYRASVYDRIPRTYVYPGYDGRANRHGEDYAHWLAITDHWDGYWVDCDPALAWTYRYYAASKYNSDRKGVDYARALLQRRAKERRGLL